MRGRDIVTSQLPEPYGDIMSSSPEVWGGVGEGHINNILALRFSDTLFLFLGGYILGYFGSFGKNKMAASIQKVFEK